MVLSVLPSASPKALGWIRRYKISAILKSICRDGLFYKFSCLHFHRLLMEAGLSDQEMVGFSGELFLVGEMFA